MKKTYVVQLIIDLIVIFMGLCNYLFPSIALVDPNITFYVMMLVYSGLELCEFIFDRTKKEPLYLAIASGVGAFSGFFLHTYDSSFVLSITIAVWMIMITIIKIVSLEEIFEKKTHLFLIRLTSMSVFVLITILVSVNIFYNISTICYMLAFVYMTYGVLELACDFLTFLSENSKFLKE